MAQKCNQYYGSVEMAAEEVVEMTAMEEEEVAIVIVRGIVHCVLQSQVVLDVDLWVVEALWLLLATNATRYRVALDW